MSVPNSKQSSNKTKFINYLALEAPTTRTLSKTLLATLLLGLMSIPAYAAESSNSPTVPTNSVTPSSESLLSIESSTDGIIALVNDTPILKSELYAALASTQERILASGQPLPDPNRLQNEVLNSLILRNLQLDMVKRSGIRPSPEAVNQRLTLIAKSQGLTSLSEFQQTLDAQQPGSYANLRAQVIQEESLNALQQSQISSRVRITDQAVDAFLASPEAQRLQNTEYRTIHIRVPFSDDYNRITEQEKQTANIIALQAQSMLKVSDNAEEVLQNLSSGVAKDYIATIQGGDMGYHEASGLPVDIATKITPLSVGDVTNPQITPQGIDVVKLVDKRNSENLVVPQWKVSHILVKTDNVSNDALAEQRINDIYEQLRRDANFASLASTYSDDPGSAGRGGDLDWVSEGQMVPEFEAVLLQTQKGDYSTPFKSQFGWHILKVEDIRQQDISGTVKRNLARETLFKRLAPQAQEDWMQEIRANAYVQIFE